MNVREYVPLSKYTTLRVGGPARYLITATSDDDVYQALQFAKDHKLPSFVLGNGSNTLFMDKGFPGVVILMQDRTVTVDGTHITAASGVILRTLVDTALEHNLRGLEELAGIPGTVGGAVRGNAGSWGTEIKDALFFANVLTPDNDTWKKCRLSRKECEFRYRDSIFKREPTWVIINATFELHTGDPNKGRELVQQDLANRLAKQPYDVPSAGSIFKNTKDNETTTMYAGALIDEAGLKGSYIGGAQISTKHANFIVNTGNATSQDILTLIRTVQRKVRDRTGITLDPEIEIVDT